MLPNPPSPESFSVAYPPPHSPDTFQSPNVSVQSSQAPPMGPAISAQLTLKSIQQKSSDTSRLQFARTHWPDTPVNL